MSKCGMSIWEAYGKGDNYPLLNNNIKVDVAIMGGGITGLSIAQTLMDNGIKTAVLEARKIGKGTTGNSTGNLYVTIDELLNSLVSKFDIETGKKVIAARSFALQYIRANILRNKFDCDLQTQPMFLFCTEDSKWLLKEQKLSKDLGVPLVEVANSDFPFSAKKVLKYPDQAQLNPLLYTQALAKYLYSGTCSIFEHSPVLELNKKNGIHVLMTPSGSISAKYVVHATHTPKGIDLSHHVRLGPYREYGIAVKLKGGNYPQGIFWEYFKNEKISFRSYIRDNEQFLIAVGKPHKVGQATNNKEHYSSLLDLIKTRFNVEKIKYCWGGQNYKPADLLPYIGRRKSGSNEFIATGFSTDGLVYGALSGKLISDLILEKNNDFHDLFDSTRINMFKSAKKFTSENMNVAGQVVKDYLSHKAYKDAERIKEGEGKIISYHGKKLAVYNDNGTNRVISANCTHMGCLVHWNSLEKSWDCPCHGSRFNIQGEVIEGPAYKALQKFMIDLTREED